MHDSIGLGLVFRVWSYVTTLVTLFPYVVLLQLDLTTSGYLNTGYNMTFVNKKWLCKHAPDKIILKMAIPLKIYSIRTSKYKFDKLILMPIYFLRVDKHKQLIYTCIYCKMHLVDYLKTNILVGNNIIILKGIIIDLANSITFITNCNVLIAITTRQRG